MSRCTRYNPGMDEANFGMSCTLWTVRFSVLFYAIAVCRVCARSGATAVRADAMYRWTWLASWILCVVHVLCAFHFVHSWNHAAALIHTAEMTERVVGIHWSGGLYINYIFLAVWGTDAFGQFRSRVTSKMMHAVAAFMMFNATVVFGPQWWIVPTAILSGFLGVVTYKRFIGSGGGFSD